jgi:hypothetical protein
MQNKLAIWKIRDFGLAPQFSPFDCHVTENSNLQKGISIALICMIVANGLFVSARQE